MNFFKIMLAISFLFIASMINTKAKSDDSMSYDADNQAFQETSQHAADASDTNSSDRMVQNKHSSFLMRLTNYNADTRKFDVDNNNAPVPSDSKHFIGGYVNDETNFVCTAAGQKTDIKFDPYTIGLTFKDGKAVPASGSQRLNVGDQIIVRVIDIPNNTLRPYSKVYVLNR